MNLRVRPIGNDRVLSVRHVKWGLDWKFQYPETIVTAEGEFMAWPLNCRPNWQYIFGGGWSYTWRPWPGYGAETRNLGCLDDEGNPEHSNFVEGLVLRASIRPDRDALLLELSLHNESERTFHSVQCDGGSLRVDNDEFAGDGVIARSFVMVDGSLRRMSGLPRAHPLRCLYTRDSVGIDIPAIVAMQSRERPHAIAYGFQDASSALANSIGGHSLQSRPWFGDIRPGETVTRCGLIRFGVDVWRLAKKLAEELAEFH